MITALLGTRLPVIQAPMAGAQDSRLTITACNAGALGSLPCAMLSAGQILQETAAIRESAPNAPFALNFFAHQPPENPDFSAWHALLAPYFAKYGIEPASISITPSRQPFAEAQLALIEELQPPAVSFHFGLPEKALLQAVKKAGALVLSSATTVREAQFLESQVLTSSSRKVRKPAAAAPCFLQMIRAGSKGCLRSCRKSKKP